MARGKKTGGRSPGTPNHVTRSARDNIIAVFTRLGGTAAMAKWARANETEFYKIYARLIPANFKVEVVSLEQAIEESWNVPLKPLPPSLAAALPAAVVEIVRSTAQGAEIEGEYTEVKNGDETKAGEA